jgi:hypothetical protein
MARIGELAQTLEQAEGLQYGSIYTDADRRIASFDPLQGGAAGECPFGDHRGRQSAPPTCIADVLPKLAKAAPDSRGGAVGRGHDVIFLLPKARLM